MKVLEKYQEDAVIKILQSYKNVNSTLVVSPGGSGKTVICSCIIQRFIKNRSKFGEKVCFFVHKEELLNQARSTFSEKTSFMNEENDGIISFSINSETKFIDSNASCYVCMVETFHERSNDESFLSYFKNVSLLIIDEAHRNDFVKIFEKFPNAKRIGFTATPISSNKDLPLKDFYQDLVEVIKMTELYEINEKKPSRGIVPCKLYHLSNINRNNFKKNKEGEFTNKSMSVEFGKTKYIDNVIHHYFEKTEGLKTLCFDTTIAHSIEMCNAFRIHGIDARHLNGDKKSQYGKPSYRRDTIEWFKNTKSSLITNVGLVNTGFDEPTVQNIILNKSIMLLSTYIQTLTRGSRACIFPETMMPKTHYVCLDFGNNAHHSGGNFGDLSTDPDWFEIFMTNKKTVSDGIQSVKSCPECNMLSPVSSRVCQNFVLDFLSDEYLMCGYVFPVKEKAKEDSIKEMVRYFNANVNIQDNIDYYNKQQGYGYYYILYRLIEQISNLFSKNIAGYHLDIIQFMSIYDVLCIKSKELALKMSEKPKSKQKLKDDLINYLQKIGYIINISEFQ